MLRLVFHTFDNRSGDEVAAEAFLLHRGKIEACPGGRVIALHVEKHWRIENRLFLRFDCGPGVVCVFETDDNRMAESYGPFEQVTCVDGVLWADANAIAALKDGEWLSMSTREASPVLRLDAAPQEPRGRAAPA